MRLSRASLLLIVLGCAGPQQPMGEISVVAQAETAASQITRVTVDVAPGSVNGVLTVDPLDPNRFTGTVVVPVGTQTVRADAFAGETKVGSGTATVIVTKGVHMRALITILDITGPAARPDHSPIVTSVVVPASAEVGDQFPISGRAIDPDHDPITIAWMASPAGCGTFADAASDSTTFTAGAIGTCTVSFTATANGKSDSKSTNVEITQSTGSIDVSVDYVPQPVISSFAFSNGVTVTRDMDATIRTPFHRGTTYVVTLAVDPWPTGTVSLSDSCGGTIVQPVFSANATAVTGTWTPTVDSGVCDLTATLDRTAAAGSLTDTFFVTVLPAAPVAGEAFPLSTSANGRYLVGADQMPFPILGRTAWFITSLDQDGYIRFIDDTAAKGFDAIEFHVLNHDPRGQSAPYADGGGLLPFTRRLDGAAWSGALTYGNINSEAPDFTQPNEAYWAFVDGLLAYAHSRQILCFMFPAYLGFGGGNQGWMAEMSANGQARMQTYGAWLATRYRGQKNLVWSLGGDYATFTPLQLAAQQGLLDGIKSVSGQQSVHFTAEWQSNSTARTGNATFGPSTTLNGAYSWEGLVNVWGRNAYAEATIPAFLQEEPYDQEGPDGKGYNANATQPVRRFEWWGWLSTIGGYIAGNGYVWPFTAGWDLPSHLSSTGAQDLARLNAFIKSLEWWKLVPSGLGGMASLITAGGGVVSSSSYVAAAADPAGSLLLAYVPPAHTGSITVDMTRLSGTVRARWFDPTSASYTAIGTYPNAGTQAFTAPGNNSAGAADWVLVLDRG